MPRPPGSGVYRRPAHGKPMNIMTGQNQLCLKKDLTRNAIPEKNQIEAPNAPRIIGGDVPVGIVRNTPTKHKETSDSGLMDLLSATSTAADAGRLFTSVTPGIQAGEDARAPSSEGAQD